MWQLDHTEDVGSHNAVRWTVDLSQTNSYGIGLGGMISRKEVTKCVVSVLAEWVVPLDGYRRVAERPPIAGLIITCEDKFSYDSPLFDQSSNGFFSWSNRLARRLERLKPDDLRLSAVLSTDCFAENQNPLQ